MATRSMKVLKTLADKAFEPEKKPKQEKPMKYKGIELKEITTPQVFDPPKQMLVWDSIKCKEPSNRIVYAVIRMVNGTTQAVGDYSMRWQHCAEIPEEPKTRRATNRELAKWCAEGNGQNCYDNGLVRTEFDYDYEDADAVIDKFLIRKWEDTEWHEPTVDYMGIEDKQVDTSHVARYAVTDKYGNQYSVRCTENGLKLFPTPVSLDKAEEIFSLAIKQFPELANV